MFKFSGRVSPNDVLHRTTSATPSAMSPDEHYIAPTTVSVTINTPPPEQVIGVPQYAATVTDNSSNPPYDPATNCKGYFTSFLFQANNNCYAYACNIATNTFPQPGRQSGYLIEQNTLDGPTVMSYAEMDGLKYVGTTIEDCLNYQPRHPSLNGHFVALMISPPGDANWPGDYHWSRCDNSTGDCNQWSQKDGNDQITNFDFAGNLITDPSQANWSVNQGPISAAPPAEPDVVVTYNFFAFMFVPFGAVKII